ncbi:MAG: S9 family peptidase [Vicinamibacterales bacterium]
MRKSIALGAVAVLCGVCLAGAPAEPRAFTPADYFSLTTVSDPQISPDGKHVAYVVASMDRKRARHNSVWLAAADGSVPPIELTPGVAGGSAPRWRRDGDALAFLSSRPQLDQDDQKTQVYLLSLRGGEGRPITALRDGVTGFDWSPNGSRLVCISRGRPADRKPPASDTRRFTSLWYKSDGSGFLDDRRAHLWVVTVASSAALQVTDGDWEDTDPQWSPDGARIAFVSDRLANGSDWEGRHADIWMVDVTGGDARRISTNDEADSSPAWSPDGKSIAFLGTLTEGGHPKVYLAPADGGTAQVLSKDPLLLAARLQWPNGANALFFEANAAGGQHLFRLDAASGRIAQVTEGPQFVRNVSFSEGARMAFRSNDYSHPDDLFVADRDGRNERRLTTMNAALAAVSFSAPEPLTWKAADGLTIHGYLVKPYGWKPGQRYPMIMQLHGGPNGMHGSGWDMDPQVFAGAGYAVFLPNPRGSSGYGDAYQRAVENEWGGEAYTDLMRGVDAVLAKFPWVDGERMGVTGHSYGGFMTDWIIGHTTRFKAATTLAGISNLVSVQGTRDAAYNHRRDFGGDLFQNYDAYWNTSPIKYAPQMKTPTMILHGEADARVPLEQGEQLFRALKHFGVPSELVIFPRASHGFRAGGDPRQLVELLQWQLYWFNKWVQHDAAAKAPVGS